jgi:hypothetical protein
VEDGAILNIGIGTDANGMDIATQDSVHPDRGIFTESNIADKLGGGIDVARRREGRSVALVGANHGMLYLC